MILADEAGRAAFLDQFAALGGYRSGDGSGNTAEVLTTIIGTTHDERFPGAVLPRLRGRRLDYYAVTETASLWRELSPLLLAFVGVTVTDFRGLTTPLDLSDPLEAWLSQQGFDAVCRFTAGVDRTRVVLAGRGLVRLRETLNRAAAPSHALPRSTQAALRDFRLALSGFDRASAEESVAFLRDNMRLDALNLAFLQVQIDAQFEDWAALRTRPFFRSLVDARRPPRVTAALVEALYHDAIDVFDEVDDVDGALTAFREKVLPSAGTLFRVLPPSARPAVGKAFLLAALDTGIADRASLDDLVARAAAWSKPEARFFDRLMTLVTDAPTPVVDSGAPSAVDTVITPQTGTVGAFGTADDVRRRLDAMLDPALAATRPGAQAILIAAAELQSLDGYQAAVQYVERLDGAEREALLRTPGFRGLWEDIAAFVAGGGVPRSWVEWLESLAELDYAQARSIAETAVDEWPVAEQLPDDDAVVRLASALQTAPEDRLQDGLPFLVDWLATDERWPNPNYDPIYDVVLTQLLLASYQTPAALGAVAQLFEGRLSIRQSSSSYRLLLDAIGEAACALASVRTLDWVLDLAELTVIHPCSDDGARRQFWHDLGEHLRPFASRITPNQLAVARDLSTILGSAEVFVEISGAAPEAPADSQPIEGLVAIYTLTENVGRRIKRSLVEEFPHATIELLHDHVNSLRLQDLASRADLFVVCWQSAKHAATNAVRAARPSHLPTLYPTGKGSSSILSEIRAFILQALSGSQTFQAHAS